jgi:hypothetical protein
MYRIFLTSISFHRLHRSARLAPECEGIVFFVCGFLVWCGPGAKSWAEAEWQG